MKEVLFKTIKGVQFVETKESLQSSIFAWSKLQVEILFPNIKTMQTDTSVLNMAPHFALKGINKGKKPTFWS